MKIIIRRILWRLLAGLGVLWGTATLTFVAINITAGDPAIAILGGFEAVPTPAVLERVRKEYHLDKPLYQQYYIYLAKLARGDLGESYRLRIPVSKAIADQLAPTAELAVWASGTAVLVSILVAVFTVSRAPWVRSFFSGTELVASSIPSFVLGIALLLIFSFQLHWLPASGQNGWKSLLLPTLTLAIPLGVMLTQIVRHELEEVLEKPFIMAARARGLSATSVLFGHALRHALIPLVTLSGSFFGMLIGSAVITETLFSRQGVGRLMADATASKDVPLVLGITMLSATAYVIANIVVDLINTFIDPRVKTI